MKKILVILFSFLMVGCATTKDMQEVIIDSKTKTEYVFPSDEELKSCEELPLISTDKEVLIKDLYKFGIDASTMYDKCSTDKDILANWIKRFKDNLSK